MLQKVKPNVKPNFLQFKSSKPQCNDWGIKKVAAIIRAAINFPDANFQPEIAGVMQCCRIAAKIRQHLELGAGPLVEYCYN